MCTLWEEAGTHSTLTYGPLGILVSIIHFKAFPYRIVFITPKNIAERKLVIQNSTSDS
jgi:hypothetical protein